MKTFRLLRIAGIILLIAGILVTVVVVFLPSTAYMERTLLVKASPDLIFQELSSFRNFKQRSPWAAQSLDVSYTIGGPMSGVGAHISWVSQNEDIRSGRIEIIDVLENQYVVTEMTFDDYGSHPHSKWMLTPSDSGTIVTWAFEETEISGFNKVFMLGIDGFLGDVYEKGLQLLKDRVEAAPQSPYQICLVNIESKPYLGIDDFSILGADELSARMEENFTIINRYVDEHHLKRNGDPFTIYSTLADSEVLFTNGIPITSSTFPEHEDIILRDSYGGLAVKASFLGNYEMMLDVHEDIKDYLAFYNYEQNGNMWEEFTQSRLGLRDSANWKINVFYPVR